MRFTRFGVNYHSSVVSNLHGCIADGAQDRFNTNEVECVKGARDINQNCLNSGPQKLEVYVDPRKDPRPKGMGCSPAVTFHSTEALLIPKLWHFTFTSQMSTCDSSDTWNVFSIGHCHRRLTRSLATYLPVEHDLRILSATAPSLGYYTWCKCNKIY